MGGSGLIDPPTNVKHGASRRPVRSHISWEDLMAKAYWIGCYRSISNPDALAGYAKLAGPAIQSAGGRFLARGGVAKVYEAGLEQRTVLIEFDSVADAVAAYESDAYKKALDALGNAAERDVRIVEGVT